VTRQADTVGFEALDFAIDRHAEVPIGVQLVWALRTRIRDGRLTPGQRLPGLRDLAEALKVNANTVRAVYQRLEREGIIESQRGSGTFVAPITQPQRSAAGEIAANAAREALRTGVDPREVAAALYVEPGATQSVVAVDEQVERRQRLRGQIAALQQALAEIEVAHPKLVPGTRGTRRARGPRLLDAEELEQVQTDLIRRLATIQIAIDESDRNADGPQLPDVPVPAPAAVTASPRPARSRAKTRPAPAGA
jgi:DNA-binding transcriptional regulator YhcF (GntR family)